jgi:hypothetical protein
LERATDPRGALLVRDRWTESDANTIEADGVILAEAAGLGKPVS